MKLKASAGLDSVCVTTQINDTPVVPRFSLFDFLWKKKTQNLTELLKLRCSFTVYKVNMNLSHVTWTLSE